MSDKIYPFRQLSRVGVNSVLLQSRDWKWCSADAN